MENVLTIESRKDEMRHIPDMLIKEVINGKPYYYKNYQSVLNNLLNAESIMGCSTLQSLIIDLLLDIFYTNIGRKQYLFLSGEIGHNIDKHSNLSYDIAVFNRNVMMANMIDTHYSKVAPKLIIEVDVRIDTDEKISDLEYINIKTQKVLTAGTERIIWILTKTRKIMIAEPNQNWVFVDWNKDIELIDGVLFNIGELLKKEGILNIQ